MGLLGPPSVAKLTRTRNIEGLIEAAENRSKTDRLEALDAMASLKEPAFIGPLLRFAFADPDIDVRIRALSALGKIKHPGSTDPLLEMLRQLLAAERKVELSSSVSETRVEMLEVMTWKVLATLHEIGYLIRSDLILAVLKTQFFALSSDACATLRALGDQTTQALAANWAEVPSKAMIVPILRDIGTPSAKLLLKKVADSEPDGKVRTMAAEAIRPTAEDTALENMRALGTDEGCRCYIEKAIRYPYFGDDSYDHVVKADFDRLLIALDYAFDHLPSWTYCLNRGEHSHSGMTISPLGTAVFELYFSSLRDFLQRQDNVYDGAVALQRAKGTEWTRVYLSIEKRIPTLTPDLKRSLRNFINSKAEGPSDYDESYQGDIRRRAVQRALQSL